MLWVEALDDMVETGASLAFYRPGTMRNGTEKRKTFLGVATWTETVCSLPTHKNVNAEGDTFHEMIIFLSEAYRRARNFTLVDRRNASEEKDLVGLG